MKTSVSYMNIIWHKIEQEESQHLLEMTRKKIKTKKIKQYALFSTLIISIMFVLMVCVDDLLSPMAYILGLYLITSALYIEKTILNH